EREAGEAPGNAWHPPVSPARGWTADRTWRCNRQAGGQGSRGSAGVLVYHDRTRESSTLVSTGLRRHTQEPGRDAVSVGEISSCPVMKMIGGGSPPDERHS